MSGDPFERFEQQGYSPHLIVSYSNALAQNARDIVAKKPEAELVGLILERGASEAERRQRTSPSRR